MIISPLEQFLISVLTFILLKVLVNSKLPSSFNSITTVGTILPSSNEKSGKINSSFPPNSFSYKTSSPSAYGRLEIKVALNPTVSSPTLIYCKLKEPSQYISAYSTSFNILNL